MGICMPGREVWLECLLALPCSVEFTAFTDPAFFGDLSADISLSSAFHRGPSKRHASFFIQISSF
jgi:hypothetical protein